jgi:5,5'-dehydrodivanillate O-demethylase oxygenase subunit
VVTTRPLLDRWNGEEIDIVELNAMNTHESPDFARVENGAPAGRLIAQFWQPVALSRDLVVGRPQRVKFLGAYYTLYRGEDGAARTTQDRCPHRGTSLAYGTVEGNSIRCRYHGWKFGPNGQGEEFPAETATYARSVCLKTYPTEEYLGLIFCFVGEGAAPAFSRFPELEDDSRGELMVQVATLPYNFFQRVENDHDEAHVFFTHKKLFANFGLTQIPKVSAQETDYGMLVVSTRPDGKQRVGYGFMPNILLREVPIPQDESKMSMLLAWRVPIDDVTTFSVMVTRIGNYSSAVRAREGAMEDPMAIAARVMRCELTLDEVDQDHPMLPVIQDTVSLAGQGVIADRSKEHLGQSDKAVAILRRMWAREMRVMQDGQPLKIWTRPSDFHFGKEIAGAELQPADAQEDSAGA